MQLVSMQPRGNDTKVGVREKPCRLAKPHHDAPRWSQIRNLEAPIAGTSTDPSENRHVPNIRKFANKEDDVTVRQDR